jgi:antitoxin VapB
MPTVSIFMNGPNQAIRIPREMEFKDVAELEVRREGDTLILRPLRPSWTSLSVVPAVEVGFLVERQDIVEESRLLEEVK